MARSENIEYVRERVTENYFWPDQQINFWVIIVLVTGGVLIGISADFVIDQNQLNLGIPWILPYGITVGSLTVFWVFLKLLLIFQRRLLPGIVMIACFILAVLYLAGVIETAIQVFGDGNINSNCMAYVNNNESHGVSLNTLAWLQQNSTCNAWYALFAFWLVGAVFFVWMPILASMVARGAFGNPV